MKMLILIRANICDFITIYSSHLQRQQMIREYLHIRLIQQKNTVYYDYDNKKIVRKDDLKIHDASKDNSIGYFPFNSTDPDQSAKDNLNYGFVHSLRFHLL